MCFGVDIGVHTNGDRRDLVHRPCDGVQHLHLGFGFDVELPDAALKREPDFRDGLAHTREHDLVTRYACRLGAEVFPGGHDIHPRTRLRQCLQHRLVRIRFHRVADQMVHPIERIIERLEVTQKRGG